MFLCLKPLDGLALAVNSRIVRRDDYARLLQAEELLELARQRVAQIEEQARERGLARGLQEAQARAAAEVGQLHAESVATLRAEHERLADLVCRVAARTLQAGGSEAVDRSLLFAVVVRHMLKAIGETPITTLRIHPSSRKSLTQALARLARDVEGPLALRLCDDESLDPDHCIAESTAGWVRGQLDGIVTEVCDRLRTLLAQPRESDPAFADPSRS